VWVEAGFGIRLPLGRGLPRIGRAIRRRYVALGDTRRDALSIAEVRNSRSVRPHRADPPAAGSRIPLSLSREPRTAAQPVAVASEAMVERFDRERPAA
jgi:hypothetical protein